MQGTTVLSSWTSTYTMRPSLMVLAIMQTWTDLTYGVHLVMKSHKNTSSIVSFGCGAIMHKSTKQKLITKSPTKAKLSLVGCSDYLEQAMWANVEL